jgi:hypothetical protein
MRGVIIDLKEVFNKYNTTDEVLDYLWDMLIEYGWIELRWGLKRLDIVEEFEIMEFAEEFIIDWFYEFKKRESQKKIRRWNYENEI